VVCRKELLSETKKLADKIVAHDPTVVSYAKQAIIKGLDLSLEQGLELEARLGSLITSSRQR